MTYRESVVARELLAGASARDALRTAGFSEWQARCPAQIITDEIRQTVERQTKELIANTLEEGLVTAEELHEDMSRIWRARMSEIKHRQQECPCGAAPGGCLPGAFLDIDQWPAIWQQMVEAGDIEIETKSERSHDGETKDQEGGWDRTGQITKVRYKFGAKTKWAELLMKHKGVNAMVEPKQGDINVTIVTAERQRQVAGARKRLAKVIDES